MSADASYPVGQENRKICIIVNPNSGTAGQAGELYAAAAEHAGVVFRETENEGHARELATDAVNEGYQIVAAAGGDGTVHEVVNGIMAAGPAMTCLGLVPLGTGNDLARTLAVPLDPLAALELLLATERTEPLDLIRVDAEGTHRYVVNAAAGGFSGQVDEAMNDGLKSQWGPLAYLLGAIAVIPDVTGFETAITYDDETTDVVNAVNVIVANGRTVGGGKRVAPPANPQDGLMDVVVVENASVLDLAGVVARLLAGNYLDSALVTHRQVRRVKITSNPGMWFNVDGELWTQEPVVFQTIPAALHVIVGSDFEPAPTS